MMHAPPRRAAALSDTPRLFPPPILGLPRHHLGGLPRAAKEAALGLEEAMWLRTK